MALQAAIRLRQKLLIAQPMAPRRPAGSLPIWPLQLLLHSGRWWLLHEHVAYGTQEGLLACTPLDGLHVFQAEQGSSRQEGLHRQALERATTLQRLCGGLWFGVDLAQQQLLQKANAEERRERLSTLRLRCAPMAMAAIRRDLERFHPSAFRLSAPLPGDSWGGATSRRYGLQADDDPLHPYPVEIDLPGWVLEGDPELRRWLLAYGPAIRIEAPMALVEEHRSALAEALALYAPNDSPAGEIAASPESPAASPEAGPIKPATTGRAGGDRGGQAPSRLTSRLP